MVQSGSPKILVIRFSSFGDIVQSLSIPTRLAELGTGEKSVEIHWVTRQDMSSLIEGHPHVSHVWKLDKSLGLKGLLQLIFQLRQQKFTHIYDAHNNLRSWIISMCLRPPLAWGAIFCPPEFLRKSQKRWKRFLLFRLRRNTYEMPFSGQRDLLEPLAQWGLSQDLPPIPQLLIKKNWLESARLHLPSHPFIAIAPSSAHPLKRWPLEHFKEVIKQLPTTFFVCLGGPEDNFIESLVALDPHRVLNLAGRLSLGESAAAVFLSQGLVTNDTGLLHIAEQIGKRAIALMGPAPFGFPSRPLTKIFQLDLPCRPCSKHGQGPCINTKFHQCLVDIHPDLVLRELRKW